MTENLYTSSRLKTLRQCLRLHYYKYILNIRGPETDVMRFGTVGHAGLEAYYRAWLVNAAPEGRLALALDECDKLPSVFDRAKLSALLVAYDLRWGSEDWEVLAVEVEFRYRLGDYLIGGKIDAIIRDRKDGRIYVVEHKTTGQDASAGSTYWERLSIDQQISIYVDGATMLGYEIAGVIYDVLERPRHEPLLATPTERRKFTKGKGCKECGGSAGGKRGVVQGSGFGGDAYPIGMPRPSCAGCKGSGWSEAPRLHADQRELDEPLETFTARVSDAIAENLDGFLKRGVVVRLDDELPKMRADIADEIKIERICAAVGLAPRNPDACSKFGTLCSFFDVCAGRADIADELRFPRGPAHPELATPQP